MFGRSFTIFKLYGFPVKVDLSWFIILFLVSWTLAVGYFPAFYGNLPETTYWLMGIAGAMGLFISIIIHEFSHSMMARRFGIPMHGITLFIFGGVSEMHEEPPSAGSEFVIAIAGPISSIVISGIFLGLGAIGATTGWPPEIRGIVGYLSTINALLAIFNLIPAFPLDGGRVLRSIFWKWKGNLTWATRVSSQIGTGFGTLLVIIGIIAIFSGSIISGIWWILIGVFLRSSAQISYKQLEIRQSLEGKTVGYFMKPNPITVPSWITLEDLVKDYFYRYYFKMFPVVDEGKLLGCVSLNQVKNYAEDEWNRHSVRELTKSCSSNGSITADTEITKALSIMNQSGTTKLMVTEDDRLVGILTLKDLLSFITVKTELEEKKA